MRVVYISGAYRAHKWAHNLSRYAYPFWIAWKYIRIGMNIYKARKAALRWWKEGYAVICPHMNTAFFDGACHDTVWLEGDLELVKRCDTIYMLTGWQQSEGSIQEHDTAIDYGLTVIYQDEDEA